MKFLHYNLIEKNGRVYFDKELLKDIYYFNHNILGVDFFNPNKIMNDFKIETGGYSCKISDPFNFIEVDLLGGGGQLKEIFVEFIEKREEQKEEQQENYKVFFNKKGFIKKSVLKKYSPNIYNEFNKKFKDFKTSEIYKMYEEEGQFTQDLYYLKFFNKNLQEIKNFNDIMYLKYTTDHNSHIYEGFKKYYYLIMFLIRQEIEGND